MSNKQFHRRYRISVSGTSVSSDEATPEKLTLEQILNVGEYEMIDELVSKCNQAEDRLQQKVNYYYKPYGQYQNCQSIFPMNYDTSDNFVENANLKWGSLAKIVLDNPQMCKNLIKSVSGDIFYKLKEISEKIQTSKFQKILAYVDDLLKHDMDNRDESENEPNVTVDEKKLRSLITLLFMIKKGKLEETATKQES
jgi:hypothetical protein